MAENNEIKVKSLQKALEILNLFTEKPVLGVTEVASISDCIRVRYIIFCVPLNLWSIWNRMKKQESIGWGFRFSI